MSTSTRSPSPWRVQWIPPNGLFMAQATARSVPVRPMGMKMPPTFSAPVSSAAATQLRT